MNYRVNKSTCNYTRISNALINDERLSATALAVMVKLLSKPDGWTASLSQLEKQGDKSYNGNSIRACFRLLATLGYAKLVKVYNEDTKSFSGSFYEVAEDSSILEKIPSIMYIKDGVGYYKSDETEEVNICRSDSKKEQDQTLQISEGLLNVDSLIKNITNVVVTNEEKKLTKKDAGYASADVVSESVIFNSNLNYGVKNNSESLGEPVKSAAKENKVTYKDNILCVRDNCLDLIAFMNYWNSKCINAKGFRDITPKRVKAFTAVLRRFDKSDVYVATKKVFESDFLNIHKNENSSWSATIDWFLNTNNFVKILEGNYDNKSKKDLFMADKPKKTAIL
jgi:hypothetical protein